MIVQSEARKKCLGRERERREEKVEVLNRQQDVGQLY
jgi:hypothetical protein